MIVPSYRTKVRWKNHDENQACVPLRTYSPSTIEEIRDIVTEAERLGVTVRAIGSSHSWSDVCVTDDFHLLPFGLNTILSLDESLLKPAYRGTHLVELQSGVRLRELNAYLDARGRALPNMGGYDGQTLVGAASTSTHGSGLKYGPLAEMIQSLDVVACEGKTYRIEPGDGITDAAEFNRRFPDRTLIQDDRWFRTVLVSMGCTGVIYSVICQTAPAFWLKEVRARTTWEDVKPLLRDRAVFAAHEHYELLLNPYARDGAHTCIVTTRDPEPEHHTPGRDQHRNVLGELVASLPGTSPAIRAYLDADPKRTPALLETSVRSLARADYVNKSYKVFNTGAVNKLASYSAEIALPMTDDTYIAGVDRILEIAETTAESGEIYESGPIALRFVRGTDIYLSPQQGQDTCMVELISVKDTLGCLELMHRYEHAMYEFGGRPHWGQVNVIAPYHVHQLYPFLQDWLSVHGVLNACGTFDSPFSRRVGLARPNL